MTGGASSSGGDEGNRILIERLRKVEQERRRAEGWRDGLIPGSLPRVVVSEAKVRSQVPWVKKGGKEPGIMPVVRSSSEAAVSKDDQMIGRVFDDVPGLKGGEECIRKSQVSAAASKKKRNPERIRESPARAMRLRPKPWQEGPGPGPEKMVSLDFRRGGVRRPGRGGARLEPLLKVQGHTGKPF